MSTSSTQSQAQEPNLIPHETIRQHCSDILHTWFDLVNTRHFNITHPFWQHNISPNYTYTGLHGDFAAYNAVDLKGQLENFKHMTTNVFPEFQMEIVDLWTEMNKKGEEVRTFMNYEQVGCPVGFRKLCAAEVRWTRNEEGRLVVWEVRTMAGAAVE